MAITRESIRSRARTRADQDKSQFPTDAQYNEFINECGRLIIGDLIQAGWPVRKTRTTITLNGDDSYLISGDSIHSITSVLLKSGDQVICELKRVDESRQVDMRTTTNGHPRWYEVTVDMAPADGDSGGNYIEIFPSGSTGYQVDVRYVQGWRGMNSDSDNWYGPEGSDELLVLMAAAKGARKEGQVNDAAALDKEYQMAWDRITQRASWFDGRNTPKIREVENLTQVDPFDYNVRNPGY